MNIDRKEGGRQELNNDIQQTLDLVNEETRKKGFKTFISLYFG